MACHKMTATSFLKSSAGKQSKNPNKKKQKSKRKVIIFLFAFKTICFITSEYCWVN